MFWAAACSNLPPDRSSSTHLRSVLNQPIPRAWHCSRCSKQACFKFCPLMHSAFVFGISQPSSHAPVPRHSGDAALQQLPPALHSSHAQPAAVPSIVIDSDLCPFTGLAAFNPGHSPAHVLNHSIWSLVTSMPYHCKMARSNYLFPSSMCHLFIYLFYICAWPQLERTHPAQ